MFWRAGGPGLNRFDHLLSEQSLVGRELDSKLVQVIRVQQIFRADLVIEAP